MLASLSALEREHVRRAPDARNGIEESRVDPAEYSAVGCDAQGQRTHCQGGEAGGLAQLPKSILQILEQHDYASTSASSFFNSVSETTLPSKRCTSRWACLAKRGSCVTMQIVEPSRCKSASRCRSEERR